MKHVDIYTDGACSNNPGKGGWAAILIYRGIEKVISGGYPMTTNNRMELFAIINALMQKNLATLLFIAIAHIRLIRSSKIG